MPFLFIIVQKDLLSGIETGPTSSERSSLGFFYSSPNSMFPKNLTPASNYRLLSSKKNFPHAWNIIFGSFSSSSYYKKFNWESHFVKIGLLFLEVLRLFWWVVNIVLNFPQEILRNYGGQICQRMRVLPRSRSHSWSGVKSLCLQHQECTKKQYFHQYFLKL